MIGFDPAEGWLAWPAPAKLNLLLRITGRRPDGYHRLQTVFRLLDWGDTVHLRLRADGVIRRFPRSGYAVSEADDLIVRAANLLKNEANIAHGADIGVEKRIPLGGGFGGGSSDAATTLVALNHCWGAGLEEEALVALGLRLGADVPVFVRGRNAWAEGVGEVLTPLPLPEAWYLIADPGVPVPTAALFQTPELTRDAAPATIADFVSGTVRGNAFEPVLRAREPAVDAVLATLSRFGEACLTGTGSGCFVAFSSRAAAEAAKAALPSGLKAWVVRGAERSPLLDRLETAADAAGAAR